MTNSLVNRVIVFLDDLQSFNEERLYSRYRDASYMSETYFTSDEIETLKDLELNGVTLRKSLDDLITKRISVDREICSSHDLKK